MLATKSCFKNHFNGIISDSRVKQEGCYSTEETFFNSQPTNQLRWKSNITWLTLFLQKEF